MKELHFSTEAQMALARMTFVYEREHQCRVKLSDDAQIIQLLNGALDSVNQDIKRCFQQFVALLAPAEVDELVYRGVRIKAGDAHAEAAAPAGVGPKTVKTTYRGVVMEVAREEAPASISANKPKRIYRGRVVED